MSVSLIPDKYATEYAIRSGARTGADYGESRNAQECAEELLVHTVRTGGSLADARAYAITAAIARDARLTLDELTVRSAREAVAS